MAAELELRAIAAEIECYERKLKTATGTCKDFIVERLDAARERERGYRK
jgi:hypothetical protein